MTFSLHTTEVILISSDELVSRGGQRMRILVLILLTACGHQSDFTGAHVEPTPVPTVVASVERVCGNLDLHQRITELEAELSERNEQ